MQNLKDLLLNERKIYLLGTAHVSKISAEQVEELILKLKPDTLVLELDEARYKMLISEDETWQEMDLFTLIRRGKAFLVMIQIILSSFQKRLAEKEGIRVGEELRRGAHLAKDLNIPIVLGDRPVETTFKRAWGGSTFWEKIKIFNTILFFSKDDDISPDEIEKLKDEDVLSSLLSQMAKALPNINKVLLDERDKYLAKKIYTAKGNTLAIVGAAHVRGVLENLEMLGHNKIKINLSELERVKKPMISLAKIFIWLLSFLIIFLIFLSFYLKGFSVGLENLKFWVLVNSIPSALAALLLRANLLTIITAALISPIASATPFISTGIVAGLVELFFNRPQVRDLKDITEDLKSLKGIFKNKITKILLLTIVINIASSIGTIIGIKYLVNIFT